MNKNNFHKKPFDSAFGTISHRIRAKKNKKPRGIRSAALMLAVFMLGSAFSIIRPTLAFFTDNATSSESVIQSGTLDVAVSSPFEFKHFLLNQGGLGVRKVVIENAGTLDFKYKISTTVTSGDSEFCSKLIFFAATNGHWGLNSLVGYESSETEFASPNDVWIFAAGVPKDVLKNYKDKTCGFDIVVTAWQKDFDFGAGGFTSQKILPSVIDATQWKKKTKDSEILQWAEENLGNYLEVTGPISYDLLLAAYNNFISTPLMRTETITVPDPLEPETAVQEIEEPMIIPPEEETLNPETKTEIETPTSDSVIGEQIEPSVTSETASAE